MFHTVSFKHTWGCTSSQWRKLAQDQQLCICCPDMIKTSWIILWWPAAAVAATHLHTTCLKQKTTTTAFLVHQLCLHLFSLTMCSRVLLSLRDPTMPTTDTVNITRPSRMSTTAGARKSPSRVRFFCLSTSAYTPTHSTQRPTSYRQQRLSETTTFNNVSTPVRKQSEVTFVEVRLETSRRVWQSRVC